LILAFVAADQIIRNLYRIRAKGDRPEKKISLSETWGGGD